MPQTTRTRRWLWVVFGVGAGALVAGAFVPVETARWHGGFPSVECRLRFIDNQGNPVKGVTLTVCTQAGGVCYFYPVDEFVPDVPVTSDAEGWMVFHHTVGTGFGGSYYTNILGMNYSDPEAPRYDCVFTLGEREVFRTRYNFHWDEWKEFHRGTVTRDWWSPGWDFTKYGWQEEYTEAWRRRQYDMNGDGKLDREEAVASVNHLRRLEDDMSWVFAVEAGRDPEERPRAKEHTFLLVERTIVIPNP